MCYGRMIDGYRGNVNSSIFLLFRRFSLFLPRRRMGRGWVGNKRFHRDSPWDRERVTLFSKNEHPLRSSFYFILFSLLVSFRHSNIKFTNYHRLLLYREIYNLSSPYISIYILYIYISLNGITRRKLMVSGTIRKFFLGSSRKIRDSIRDAWPFQPFARTVQVFRRWDEARR